jgi:hypothetical protein
LSARRLILHAAALDEPGEVLEILPHDPLGVRDGLRHDRGVSEVAAKTLTVFLIIRIAQ